MIAIVPVMRLIVVDGARVFRPQLNFVNFELARAEKALGRVDEIGMSREPVQVPGGIRKQTQAGKLTVA